MLSRDPVTNIKNHFVITTALLTRICRRNGMEMEQAYRLSDHYIRLLDDIRTVEEVRLLHERTVMDFARKMRRIRRKDECSKHIVSCKDYIYTHIQERITLEDMAEAFCLSASYLSRLFKKETGMSVSDYIRERKIRVAMSLLRHSDKSILDIANQLAFSSQSHFIQQFKATTGMTPKKYRSQHAMVPWDQEIMGE